MDKKKGLVLFHVTNIEDVNTTMTFRELSRYGMECDCSWTASSDNTMVVKVFGRSTPLIFCFESNRDRDLVYNLISV